MPNPMYGGIGMQPGFQSTQGQFGMPQANFGMVGITNQQPFVASPGQLNSGQGTQMNPNSVPMFQSLPFDILTPLEKPTPYKEGGKGVTFTTFTGFDDRKKALSFLQQFDKAYAGGNFTEAFKIYLYGGQVTSWKNVHGDELLFMSSKAMFKPPKAIRGGIPICFPQFSNLGSLEAHGFARNRFWTIDPNPPPPPVNGITTYIDLILKPSELDMKIWPHSFEFRLRVALGVSNLTLTSRIRNTDEKPFSFTFAMHTYFSVSDISEVRVEGLETLDYFDNLQNRTRFTEQGDALTFDGEVDRIYLSTPTKIAIIDHEKKRTFVLRKEGLPDAVVWNPWDKKSRTITDLGDEDYKSMVCVEAAAIEKPISLKRGEEWRGRQEILAVSSSYCSGQLDPNKVLSS
ncbi:hypothetical protein L7F22_061025 [Adiantum nelumboides]|nr:hypothetical protein [Adiantum nelumboides]MCO5606834.1 hypothetical protein [Adiantum nelumboides]